MSSIESSKAEKDMSAHVFGRHIEIRRLGVYKS